MTEEIKNKRGVPKKGDPEKVRQLWIDGFERHEIAQRVRLSPVTVWRYLRGLHLNHQEIANHYENRATLIRQGNVKK